MTLTPQPAIDLIYEFEGIDQPGEWPGGDSGISLGRGYDLSAESARELVYDWTPQLGHVAVNRLLAASGKSGQEAEALAKSFRDIKITEAQANAVFISASLPKYEGETQLAFRASALLPPLAFGALVSLVYNRGTSMHGDSRREMLAIRQAIAQGAQKTHDLRDSTLHVLLIAIAAQIRSMKRLWEGKGLEGLLKRRDAEAALVESAIPKTV